jgi:hypothetical protein
VWWVEEIWWFWFLLMLVKDAKSRLIRFRPPGYVLCVSCLCLSSTCGHWGPTPSLRVTYSFLISVSYGGSCVPPSMWTHCMLWGVPATLCDPCQVSLLVKVEVAASPARRGWSYLASRRLGDFSGMHLGILPGMYLGGALPPV